MDNRSSLVVGVNGNIGSAIFSHLQSKGCSVFGTTRQKTSQQNIFYLNLLDSPDTWDFKGQHFDIVYICAGVCRMSLCEEDPEGTKKVNVDGILSLIRKLSAEGSFIVYLSTNQVFSGNKAFVTPESTYQPLNEYGRQKAYVEQSIQSECKGSAIVRLTKVIEPKMSLIQSWINKLEQHEPVEAFHDMVMAPVTLSQVVEDIIRIGNKKHSGCYQISGASDVSYYDAACYLAESLQKPLSLIKSVSAVEYGIKKNFLPRFTTLDCSSTIATCGGNEPPHFTHVLHECFGID